MGAGDVEVQIIPQGFTSAELDTIITAMRVTAGANGKFMMASLGNQLIVVAITEA